MKPDPQVIVEQLLLAHLARGGFRIPLGLGGAGDGLLRAAGLRRTRARAVNMMAQRVAKSWRKEGHTPSATEISDEARRLLR